MDDGMMDVQQLLDRLKDRLTRLLGDSMVRLVLFGSRARGDHDESSDIDVAVVVRGGSRELRNRILDETARIEFEACRPVSLIVFSEQEFDRLCERERRIALDIKEEGIPLWPGATGGKTSPRS